MLLRHSGYHGTKESRYEACNPATGARGMVPVQYFQVLGKNQKDSSDLRTSVARNSVQESESSRRDPKLTKSTPLYGVVQYDFQAERPDELDAKAGEAIIVIAQSNHEWFVAKPIGRLGGPGLIPVSFIEIRDMSTGKPINNLEELAAKAAVPKVEEWKKAAAEYKSSSIPLGRFDFDRRQSATQDNSEAAVSRESRDRAGSNGNGRQQQHDVHTQDPLHVVKASVDQYLRDESRYWFLVRVVMNDGRHRNLCRYYEDFYEFQIALLEEFPAEAGRTGEQRILPFMPGPLTYVDDTISAQRRTDLCLYVEELCRLPAHIVRHPLVQDLFSAREGDVESSHPTSMMPQPIFKPKSHVRVSGASRESSHQSEASGAKTRSSHYSQHDARSGSSIGNGQVSKSFNEVDHARPTMREPTNTSSFLKIKVFYEEDLIAIRVAIDIDFHQLCEKLRDRLTGPWTVISVKDESRNVYQQIADDNDFKDLLERTDKVVLYVQ